MEEILLIVCAQKICGLNLEKKKSILEKYSIYNHSYEPNATYKKKTRDKSIDFVANKNIQKDEEITTNYNYGDPEDKTTIWDKSIHPFKSNKTENNSQRRSH